MKREMRRKDRMISEEECLKALEEAEYGSLATISEDGSTIYHTAELRIHRWCTVFPLC